MLHFDTRAEALRMPPVRCLWPVGIVLNNGKLNAAARKLFCVDSCDLVDAFERAKNTIHEIAGNNTKNGTD